MTSRDMKDCPNCGHQRRDAFRICASCGFDFTTQSTPYSAKVSLQVPGVPGEITLTPTELMVMSHAVEDWWGLWEVPPSNYKPAEYAEAPDPQALMLAAVRHLLRLGLIELGLRSSGMDVPIRVPEHDTTKLLQDQNSWDVPSDTTEVTFTATKLGERLFLADRTTE